MKYTHKHIGFIIIFLANIGCTLVVKHFQLTEKVVGELWRSWRDLALWCWIGLRGTESLPFANISFLRFSPTALSTTLLWSVLLQRSCTSQSWISLLLCLTTRASQKCKSSKRSWTSWNFQFHPSKFNFYYFGPKKKII